MKKLLWAPVAVIISLTSCGEGEEKHVETKPPFNMLEFSKINGKVKSMLAYTYRGADTSCDKLNYQYFEYDNNGMYIIERSQNFLTDFPGEPEPPSIIKCVWDGRSVTSFNYRNGVLENKIVHIIDGNKHTYEIIDTTGHTDAFGSIQYDDNNRVVSSEYKLFSEFSEVYQHSKTTMSYNDNITEYHSINLLTNDTNIRKQITVEKNKYGNTIKEYTISQDNDTTLTTYSYTHYE